MKNLLHRSKVLSETIKNINIPMRKLLKERKLFKGGNYMRKYGISTSKMNSFRGNYSRKYGCKMD
jgi:hypothetical protein